MGPSIFFMCAITTSFSCEATKNAEPRRGTNQRIRGSVPTEFPKLSVTVIWDAIVRRCLCSVFVLILIQPLIILSFCKNLPKKEIHPLSMGVFFFLCPATGMVRFIGATLTACAPRRSGPSRPAGQRSPGQRWPCRARGGACALSLAMKTNNKSQATALCPRCIETNTTTPGPLRQSSGPKMGQKGRLWGGAFYRGKFA